MGKRKGICCFDYVVLESLAVYSFQTSGSANLELLRDFEKIDEVSLKMITIISYIVHVDTKFIMIGIMLLISI